MQKQGGNKMTQEQRNYQQEFLSLLKEWNDAKGEKVGAMKNESLETKLKRILKEATKLIGKLCVKTFKTAVTSVLKIAMYIFVIFMIPVVLLICAVLYLTTKTIVLLKGKSNHEKHQ